MTDAPLIDAHLHLWDIASGGYEWLTSAAGPLYATFTAEQAEAELAARAAVRGGTATRVYGLGSR
ncbi:hypothetical protein SCB71_00700 [Herbiconiux sp. KACC 21604]|uniref:hypothetical protein n=1 Tax=unclassified Herbiconiux TaxID=2618217 RepID=UPI001490B164|nr:hypothetical protein [Herbiconiux sp. SALV-R1]QJU55593.1 hypothetical protein HL652_19555 [Herbiconiux sp. SALV-R1]WPO86788.1 hypothetical protein SCB71_00700 [Herbiconiux sp. KACC 21604]